jgi:hypothetical protein
MTLAPASLAALALGSVLGACAGDTLSAGSEGDAAVLAAVATPTTRATLASRVDALALDATDLYFTSEDGALYRLARAGTSPPVRLATAAVPGSNSTEALALDATTIYWTAFGDGAVAGAVLSLPKSGGVPVTLAAEQARPAGLAVDEASVYWADQGPPAVSDNLNSPPPAIMKVAKGGGAATVLYGAPVAPDALTLGPTDVVWHESQAIARVPKAGGAAVTMTSSAIPWASSDLVVAGASLYFAANQAGWSLQALPLAGGAVSTLAVSTDTPAAVFVDATAGALFFDVASGAGVGSLASVPLSGGSVTARSPADVVPGAMAEQAHLLVGDATAFYWVEEWETPALVVVIRSLAR